MQRRTVLVRLACDSGSIIPVAGTVSPVLTSSRDDSQQYVSVGVEPYGVYISTKLGATLFPLLRFEGLRLQNAWTQGAAQPNT
jgi:hypothetical protein